MIGLSDHEVCKIAKNEKNLASSQENKQIMEVKQHYRLFINLNELDILVNGELRRQSGTYIIQIS